MSHKRNQSHNHYEAYLSNTISLLMGFTVFKMRWPHQELHANNYIYSMGEQNDNKKKYLLKKKFPKREESMQSKKSTRKALIMK